jgi:hypothetical protein
VRVAARDMEFRVRIAGTKGDPVILLHGSRRRRSCSSH